MATTIVHTPGLSSRPRLLTNSAAEFLETRADAALGSELAETSPEFVPELDRFVTRDDVPKQDYFKESEERVKQFKTTLAAFQKNLIDRKVDQRYEVELKDAVDYTLEDVLKIAQTVQQKHKDADKVQSCMGKIKKFFHATGRNASTFKKLVSFVPDDVYGSVICGGFTIILTTLERLEKLRTEMYSALEKIPKTLRKIHDLLDVHYQSPRLKYCADAVLVAIFVLLELIIRELSGSVGKKVLKSPFKGDRYGASIDEAVESLEESVKEFESEARICDSQKLGQVDLVTKKTLTNTAHLSATTQRTEKEVRQLAEGLSSFKQQFVTQLKVDQAAIDEKQVKLLMNTEEVLNKLEQAELTTQKHGAEVINNIYCFLAADPLFNSKTGTLDPFHAQRRMIRALTPVSMTSEEELPPPEAIPFSDSNQSLVRSWMKASGDAPRIAAGDLLECFESLTARPTLAEQDRISYVLTSNQVREWLRSVVSKLLVVEIRSDPDHYSAASYASTVLVRSIQKAGRFPVLYHFCTPRATDPANDELKSGAGLYVSLISQLLVHLRRGSDVDLEFLRKTKRRLKKGKCKMRILRRTFEQLTQLLTEGEWLYVIVDSIWKLQNQEDEEAVAGLLGLVKKEGLPIKLLVADPFSMEILEPLEKREERRTRKAQMKKGTVPESSLISLHVPDNVDGLRAGFNTSWVEQEMGEMVEECHTSQSGSNSEEESRIDLDADDESCDDSEKQE